MADSSKKVSELPVVANVASSDRVVVLYRAGNTSTQYVGTSAISTLFANSQSLLFTNSVPANSSSNGVAGTFAHSANTLYICVATNSWVKVSTQTF